MIAEAIAKAAAGHSNSGSERFIEAESDDNQTALTEANKALDQLRREEEKLRHVRGEEGTEAFTGDPST